MPSVVEGSPRKRRRVGSGQETPSFPTLMALRHEGHWRSLDDPTTKLGLSELLKKVCVENMAEAVVREELKEVRETVLGVRQVGMIDGERVGKWLSGGVGKYTENKRVNIERGCEKVIVVGSWLLGLGVLGEDGVEIDLAMEMPTGLFGKRDFGGIRYWWKRALWLGWVAEVMSKENKWADIAVGEDYLTGNVNQPVLTMRSRRAPSLRVRILPMISDYAEDEKVGGSRASLEPNIRAEAMMVTHLSTLHSVSESAPGFAEAVKLLKLWCRRRRIRKGSFVVTSTLAQLLLAQKLPKSATRDHLLRAVLAAFAACKNGGILSCLPGTVLPSQPEMDRWAEEALALLNSTDALNYFCQPRAFRAIPVPLVTLFDAYITVSLKQDGTVEDLNEVLLQAYVRTGRVKSLIPIRLTASIASWGIFLEVVHASRRVDICKSEKLIDSFRNFWGGKAELRRFKNGEIKYAVVWQEKQEVISQILEYLVESRSWIDSGRAVFTQVSHAGNVSSDPGFSSCSAAFSELCDVLRRCENIPLQISSVQSSSPFLRRTAVSAARPSLNSRFVEPIDTVVSFESSSAWPADATAIAAAKAGFYCNLGTSLAQLGVQSTPAISHLDVSLGGFYFRVIVRVKAEASLLKKGPSQKLKYVTETTPALHDRLRSIANPSFPPAARLAKKWLASQLLLDAMGPHPELLVDVIVAHAYAPGRRQPSSPLAGFSNFLLTLVDTPWEMEPLIVNITTNSEEDLRAPLSETEMRSKIAKLTDGEQNAGMQVIVLGDFEVALCTHGNGPEPVVVRRIRAAAAASLDWLDRILPGSGKFSLENTKPTPSFATLFTPDLTVYDVVIRLSKKYISRGKGMRGLGGDLIGLDLVATYVEKLENELGRHCLFLFDRYGGDKVCVVWRPEIDTKFALSKLAYSKVEPNGNLSRDKKAIIQAMERIGGGIVESVKER